MKLTALPHPFSVCKLNSLADTDLSAEFCFLSKTDEEISLVCPTDRVPPDTAAREDGWRGMRVCGVLDFSLVGILANIATILADAGVSVFAVSTYNTDYILVKNEHLECAVKALSDAGYEIE